MRDSGSGCCCKLPASPSSLQFCFWGFGFLWRKEHWGKKSKCFRHLSSFTSRTSSTQPCKAGDLLSHIPSPGRETLSLGCPASALASLCRKIACSPPLGGVCHLPPHAHFREISSAFTPIQETSTNLWFPSTVCRKRHGCPSATYKIQVETSSLG